MIPDWKELAHAHLEPVTDGMSSALLFRVVENRKPDRYLKIAREVAIAPLRQEIERTQWLEAQGFRVPAILRVEDGADEIVMLSQAVPGLSAEDSMLPVDRLIDALADGLAALHRLPPDDCPFDETLRVRLARAAEAVTSGLVDVGEFEPRNRNTTPEALLARLKEDLPREDIVVVHGDATLTNLIVDDDDNLGFVDCGNVGRGDRYVDLAVLAAELEEYYGEDAAAHFLRVYGMRHWDTAKARYFSDLYELF
jgi:aminoglycoside 3'-phosphotransferase II